MIGSLDIVQTSATFDIKWSKFYNPFKIGLMELLSLSPHCLPQLPKLRSIIFFKLMMEDKHHVIMN